MYAGEPTDVYLIVEEPLVEEMFDKFGMNIKLMLSETVNIDLSSAYR